MSRTKNHSIKCLHGTPQQTVKAGFFHFTVHPSRHYLDIYHSSHEPPGTGFAALRHAGVM
jgi:hypothetical protein